MSDKPTHIFHQAVAAQDLSAAHAFYVEGLGCRLARKYEDRITLEFFGHQVVCHLSNKIDTEPTMYPRHFGITFAEANDYEAVLARAKKSGLKFFQEPFIRFEGRKDEHRSFFLMDPSNNLIEFKYYRSPEMMY